MIRARSGEVGEAPPARSNRFYFNQGAWYFYTREGASIGPFDDRAEAGQGLGNFLEFLRVAKPALVSKLYRTLKYSSA